MTKRVGVLYAEESNQGLLHPYFSLILNAFLSEAQSRGYDVTFLHPAAQAEGEAGQDDAAYSPDGQVDGICMVCTDFYAPLAKKLVDISLPCVTIDHIFKKIPAVLSDNETGVKRLVEYAIAKGHRRIAFLHGQNNSIVTRTRINQFYNTLKFHDIPVSPDYVVEGLYNDISAAREQVLRLLRLTERPTCILLPDDLCYLGAQEAARELGLRIPEDISFAGYDGIPLTQALTPQLTTVRQSSEDMGSTAAAQLIDMIENPGGTFQKVRIFPVELMEGGTIR